MEWWILIRNTVAVTLIVYWITFAGYAAYRIQKAQEKLDVVTGIFIIALMLVFIYLLQKTLII